MSTQDIYLFFLLHIVFCLLYYVYVARKNKFQVFSECMIVFFIPIFGLLFVCGVRIASHFQGEPAERPDIYHQVKNEHSVDSGMAQGQVDVISLNDALFIEDTKEKRALLTNAIKQNVLHNQQILRKAIKDSDREVAHYAVSMVTNQIEEIEAALYRCEALHEKNPDDQEILKQYIAAVKEYLDMDFLDQISQRRHEELYALLLEKLLAAAQAEQATFLEKIAMEIKLKRFAKAADDCERFKEAFPEDEMPYLSYMKHYHKLHDEVKLQETIRALKACPIQLSAHALEAIRFWDRSMRNG